MTPDHDTTDERAASALERIADALETIAENGSKSLSLATVLSGRTPSVPQKIKIYRVDGPDDEAPRAYLSTWRDDSPIFTVEKTRQRLLSEFGPGRYLVQLHGSGWGGDYHFNIA